MKLINAISFVAITVLAVLAFSGVSMATSPSTVGPEFDSSWAKSTS